MDARAPSVVEVDCRDPAVAATITSGASSYLPARVEIVSGQVIRFHLDNPHDAMSGEPAAPESWFFVGGNDPTCLRFDEVGTFPFFCQVHPTMTGRVVVGARAVSARAND